MGEVAEMMLDGTFCVGCGGVLYYILDWPGEYCECYGSPVVCASCWKDGCRDGTHEKVVAHWAKERQKELKAAPSPKPKGSEK